MKIYHHSTDTFNELNSPSIHSTASHAYIRKVALLSSTSDTVILEIPGYVTSGVLLFKDWINIYTIAPGYGHYLNTLGYMSGFSSGSDLSSHTFTTGNDSSTYSLVSVTFSPVITASITTMTNITCTFTLAGKGAYAKIEYTDGISSLVS